MQDKVLILIYLSMLFLQDSAFQQYFMENDATINFTSNQLWFLESSKQNSKTNCLVTCNLNLNCLSVIFSEYNGTAVNCMLYSKYFKRNETFALNSSIVHIKNSELYIFISYTKQLQIFCIFHSFYL